MKKKTPWWQTFLLVVFAVALAFGSYQVEQVGNHLQYMVKAPAQAQQDTSPNEGEETQKKAEPNKPIAESLESLKDQAEEWNGVMRAWSLGGVVESANYTADNDGSGYGRLTLMGERGLELHPLLLRYGRAFFPEELEKGAKVIILDEQLALSMFRISDPVDRIVTIEGTEYKVIGIARHTKQVGDFTDAGAYIPLMSVIDQPIRLDALMVEADPLPGMGASVAFSTVCTSWGNSLGGSGTVIDLGKEGMAAKLWLRVLLFLVGATVLLRLIRWLNGRAAYYAKRYHQQLQLRYAINLMPELTGVIILFILGYGSAAALAAILMNYIIQPVYTFTEWIPAVLVEWKDIADAFWQVWQTSATLQELRSPEILRLRYYTLLIQGCSAAAGVLLALRYARRRSTVDIAEENLRALYSQGVAVSLLRTSRPITFSAMEYVPCVETDAWTVTVMNPRRRRLRAKSTTPMIRVINARRILEQLPPSPKEGRFVLEVTDKHIPANNARWLITCEGGKNTIEAAEREWDLQLPVETLTRLVYGSDTFRDFLECNAGYDLRMRSPAMDGLFDQHLPLTSKAL